MKNKQMLVIGVIMIFTVSSIITIQKIEAKSVMINDVTDFSDKVRYYFKMDESTGITTSDSINSSFTGILRNMNSSNWIDGKIGSTLYCNGVDEYIEFSEPIQQPYNESLAIEFWYNISSTISAASYLIATQESISDYTGWGVFIRNSGIIGFQLQKTAGSDRIVVDTEDSFFTNDSNHIVVNYNGNISASGVQIYVNNNLVNFTIIADSLTGNITANTNFQISSRGNDTNYAMKGFVDEVVLYNDMLTLEQIAFRYNNSYGTQLFETPAEPTPEPTTTTTIWGIGGNGGDSFFDVEIVDLLAIFYNPFVWIIVMLIIIVGGLLVKKPSHKPSLEKRHNQRKQMLR